MELLIVNKDDLDLYDFCEWLKEHILQYIQSILQPAKLMIIDKFLNNNVKIDFIDKLPRLLSSKDIIISAIKNLVIIRQGSNYVITLNDKNFIPNTYAKFNDIIRLINYGNYELSPYPIIEETFDYFADNLQQLYNEYIKENGNGY